MINFYQSDIQCNKVHLISSLDKKLSVKTIVSSFTLLGGPGLVVAAALPNPNFGFLSAGFKIWKEHIKLSSTLIMALALSSYVPIRITIK